ncbi:MAG TPA: YciI family protein [Amycolatopsis sp.]|uniref:YciI family protein n=1 Tax=Amycolatopsis sp. TaxID=37632 RepID=UPI002B481BA2|nr:YciI family protein [Amycolatopsis sp.]HKS45587.1 YciI family protein [Amycolatopsis sp.]
MAWFLVEIRYVPEKFAAVRPAHREFLEKLADQGVVLVAGPIGDDVGGLALYQAENAEELRKIIDTDPYHVEGVIAERTVREFKPVIGAWVP